MKKINRYNRKTGVHVIAETAKGERVVGILEHNGKIVIATTKEVCIVTKGGDLEKINPPK